MGNKVEGVLGTLLVLGGLSLALGGANVQMHNPTQKFGAVTAILGVTILERAIE